MPKILNSHAYQLQHPYKYNRLHNVFHTSFLRPVTTNPLPGQTNPPSQPVTLNKSGEKLYAIEAIIDSEWSKKKNNFQYLIVWRGHDSEDKTWKPLKNVVFAKKSIQEFERPFPQKLNPTKAEINRARPQAIKSVKKVSIHN